jgi:hypothetical protein
MIRVVFGLLLLALALAVTAWGAWKLYGPRKRVRGMRIRLPGDEA